MTDDFDREVFGKMWVVVPAVLGLTFVVLLVAFRSVLIPVKAIALNLVSVLASYGFLTIVFQEGLNSFIVLVLFTILFGLSMDYEVFLLQRITHEYDRTGDNAGAVSRGLTDTAGIISSAAVIMVSIFTAFGFTRLVATREFGLGLAFAIALDATLMRLVLVPALMVLFGSVNWWLPAWLERLLPGNRYGAEDARDPRGRCTGTASRGVSSRRAPIMRLGRAWFIRLKPSRSGRGVG